MQAKGMVNIESEEHQRNPHKNYAIMQEKYPVCRVEPIKALAVTRYDDVKFVLRNYEIFSSAGCKAIFDADWLRPECKRDNLVFKDPPEHTKFRNLVKIPFSHRIMTEQAIKVRDSAEELVGKLGDNEFDFLEEFAYPFVAENFAEFIGVKTYQTIQELREWVDVAVTLGPVKPNDEAASALEEVLIKQKGRFMRVINNRRGCPQRDMITELLEYEIDGHPLPDNVLIDTIDILVLASFHTVIHTLASSILWLSRNLSMVALLKQNRHLIGAFVEEMLRLKSSGHASFRLATREHTLSGITIPAGALVLPIMSAANRDPRHFANPDTVDLYRNNLKEHLAFGIGVHTCPGVTLARMELNIALEVFLQHCNAFICDESRITYQNTVTTFGYKSFPLKLA